MTSLEIFVTFLLVIGFVLLGFGLGIMVGWTLRDMK